MTEPDEDDGDDFEFCFECHELCWADEVEYGICQDCRNEDEESDGGE